MSAGSTGGWEAAALGVPTIHVDLSFAASNNPMFTEPALCRTAHDAEELVGALREIAGLSDRQFKVEANLARRYFEASFARKTDDAFKRIVAWLRRGSVS